MPDSLPGVMKCLVRALSVGKGASFFYSFPLTCPTEMRMSLCQYQTGLCRGAAHEIEALERRAGSAFSEIVIQRGGK